MFHSYYAHSLDQLAQQFANEIESRTTDPLKPMWVIVQNNEIKEWLSLKIAEKQGIAGNFRFIFPSEFLWTIYRLVEEEVPKVLPSDLNSMQWTLFNLFGQKPELLNQIPAYNETEDGQSKRFQLCGQIADIFDQYQVYRPDMLQNWLAGKPVTKHPDELWQLKLWRLLSHTWYNSDVNQTIISRSSAYHDLITWLDEGNKRLIQALPEQVFVFGLSHLSQPFLEIVTKISKVKKVHFFSRRSLDYSNLNSLNSLIETWSSSFTKQHNILHETIRKENTGREEVIFDEIKPSAPELAIHSCHGIRREVEVLKDAILHYLDNNPESLPNDILVMVPDADEYASLIESIFSNEENLALPVSKLLGFKRQSVDYTLITILELINSSFKPSSVIEVMNLEPVKEAFSFSDDELNRIEEWIIEKKIFRGVGDHYSSAYSWQKSLNELIAGLAMAPDELEIYDGLIPQSGITSVDDMKLVARFSRFMEILISSAKDINSAKTPINWLKKIETLLKTLLDSEQAKQDFSRLYQKLSRLREQVAYSNIDEAVDYTLFKSWLKNQFDTSSSSSGRFGQGITVSSYIPYRSVPFKFIAILGMNEGVFPRKAVRPEFDLIHAFPKPGDRIQKEDDTFLFLETLTSAKDHLHISYRGQDMRSDIDRLPSTLVQQLIEALPENKYIQIKHSLHPFNARYFENKSEFKSYSKANKYLAETLIQKPNEIPVFTEPDFVYQGSDLGEIVTIRDFTSFFVHSSKYICSNYLSVSDRNSINEISDREAFDLDGLSKFQLGDFMLKNVLAGHPKKIVYEYASVSSLIPDKLKGRKLFDSEFHKVSELAEAVQQVTESEGESISIDLEIEGVKIEGSIPGVYGNALVYSRSGKRKPKYEAEHWLNHLLLLASGHHVTKSVFISKEKDGMELLEIKSEVISNKILKELMRWFKDEGPILNKTAFFPETSKVYVETWLDKRDGNKALDKSRKAWEPSHYRTWVESNDFYNQLIWRNRDPLVLDSFKENAFRFWQPYIAAVEESQDGE